MLFICVFKELLALCAVEIGGTSHLRNPQAEDGTKETKGDWKRIDMHLHVVIVVFNGI